MDLLWQPGKIGPMELKNRVVRSATNEHLSEPNGDFSPVWVDVLTELARHEIGLVITGHVCVDRTQRANEGQPAIDETTTPELLRQAAEGVHAYGAKLVMQLNHSGFKAPEHVNGRPPKGPADFTLEEIDRLTDAYVYAAKLCKACGFDGVQIHNAHGYLLSSFLNPEENKRTDEYGGSLENRFRLPARIIREVRAACGPDFALLVKMNCNGVGDLPGALRLYEESGVDAIEISGVDFSSKAGVKEPFYLEELLAAKQGIQTPFILVGGIFSRRSAEQVLSAGIPFVAFSRALICQPDFIAKMKRGEQEESTCFACNSCYGIYRKRPVRCVQHQTLIPQLTKNYPSNAQEKE